MKKQYLEAAMLLICGVAATTAENAESEEAMDISLDPNEAGVAKGTAPAASKPEEKKITIYDIIMSVPDNTINHEAFLKHMYMNDSYTSVPPPSKFIKLTERNKAFLEFRERVWFSIFRNLKQEILLETISNTRLPYLIEHKKEVVDVTVMDLYNSRPNVTAAELEMEERRMTGFMWRKLNLSNIAVHEIPVDVIVFLRSRHLILKNMEISSILQVDEILSISHLVEVNFDNNLIEQLPKFNRTFAKRVSLKRNPISIMNPGEISNAFGAVESLQLYGVPLYGIGIYVRRLKRSFDRVYVSEYPNKLPDREVEKENKPEYYESEELGSEEVGSEKYRYEVKYDYKEEDSADIKAVRNEQRQLEAIMNQGKTENTQQSGNPTGICPNPAVKREIVNIPVIKPSSPFEIDFKCMNPAFRSFMDKYGRYVKENLENLLSSKPVRMIALSRIEILKAKMSNIAVIAAAHYYNRVYLKWWRQFEGDVEDKFNQWVSYDRTVSFSQRVNMEIIEDIKMYNFARIRNLLLDDIGTSLLDTESLKFFDPLVIWMMNGGLRRHEDVESLIALPSLRVLMLERNKIDRLPEVGDFSRLLVVSYSWNRCKMAVPKTLRGGRKNIVMVLNNMADMTVDEISVIKKRYASVMTYGVIEQSSFSTSRGTENRIYINSFYKEIILKNAECDSLSTGSPFCLERKKKEAVAEADGYVEIGRSSDSDSEYNNEDYINHKRREAIRENHFARLVNS